jgi:hypothetical protein
MLQHRLTQNNIGMFCMVHSTIAHGMEQQDTITVDQVLDHQRQITQLKLTLSLSCSNHELEQFLEELLRSPKRKMIRDNDNIEHQC